MPQWQGALETLSERQLLQEKIGLRKQTRSEVLNKMHKRYLESRTCPIRRPAGDASMVRIKQDRGPSLTDRTRGNAHPERTHSKSLTSGSILGITSGPTARSMDAVKGADLQDVHPWKLLALCSSDDKAVNVAAIHAIKEVGREKMCSALAGGYPELIERILGEVNDSRPTVRAAIVQALGSLALLGDQRVIEELMVAADDQDDYVRASALSSLALVTQRERAMDRCSTLPVQAVMARITDDDPDVREAAVLALGALAPIGDKLAVETILHALEDSNPTVQNAAVDGLILLGDVYEEEAGENRLLEVMITSVQPRLARSQCNNSTHDSSEVHISFDDSDQLVRQQKAEESGDTDRNVKWMLSVAVEPEITLAGDCGPVQALQHWITLFGIQDFDSRVRGYLDDGRSKLLALVEDALVVIEGDIEQDSRLVFWWPAGQRRVLFQTSGNWAWEYRRQCKYAEGYSYCDADTGEDLFALDFTFDKYFFVDTDEQNLWNTIFMRGHKGGLSQELGRFPSPVVSHATLDMNTEQPRNRLCTANCGEYSPAALGTCCESFQIDTDIVNGCKSLLSLCLIRQIGHDSEIPSSKDQKTHGTVKPLVLSTIISLAQTGNDPMRISHALQSEEDSTWFEGSYILIDAEQDLGMRNQKQTSTDNVALPKANVPTRAQIFGGQDFFTAKGTISLKTRHSDVQERIVGGILSRLESPNLHVRNAAVSSIQHFIGFGNLHAVEGVLCRLEHPELDVRATAVHALKYVAEVGHVQALQGCLHRIKREEWFIRASALDAFCNICHSDDPVLMQVLEKLIDDKDFRVRTAADVHLRHFEKSRKAKDFDVAVASSKVLEQHEYYHKWHARQRELVAREQFDGAQEGERGESPNPMSNVAT